MATYSVVRAKHATLGVATVDTVNFSVTGGNLRVRNRSTSVDIYLRVDGTAPVSLADDNYFVGPGENLILEQGTGQPLVKLISAAACDYTVEVW